MAMKKGKGFPETTKKEKRSSNSAPNVVECGGHSNGGGTAEMSKAASGLYSPKSGGLKENH